MVFLVRQDLSAGKQKSKTSVMSLLSIAFAIILVSYIKSHFDAVLPTKQFQMIRQYLYERLLTVLQTQVLATGTNHGVAKKKAVKGANKERLFQEFEKLYVGLDKVLTEQNMKSTLKDLKAVRHMTYRLLKLKKRDTQKRDTNNSGFMKPIRVSGELEAFLQKNGLYQTDLTRAYLTTVLCSYIRSKNLRNLSDQRIFFPDEDLKSLFNITDNDSVPMTYYSLQKRIKTHIRQ